MLKVGAWSGPIREMLCDKQFVMSAVTQKGRTYKCLPEKNRADRTLLLKALAQTGFAWNHAPKWLKDDPEILLMGSTAKSHQQSTAMLHHP